MPTIHPVLPADGDDAVVEPYNAALNLILGVLNGSIDVDNLADGAVGLSKLSAAVQGALVPTGAINAFGGTNAPSGYLMCDGSSYLRGSYPSLFAVLGTAYGSADGTHFNVPDLRGRIPVGADAMGGSAANRIQRTTTITTTNASTSATVGSSANLATGMYVVSANVPAGTYVTGINGTSITLSANATATGSAVAARFTFLGNDAQLLGANGGTDTHTLVIAQMANHQHRLDRSGPSYGASTASSGYGGNVALSVGSSGDTSIYVEATGGGQPHSNTQPSLTVNYIIKT